MFPGIPLFSALAPADPRPEGPTGPSEGAGPPPAPRVRNPAPPKPCAPDPGRAYNRGSRHRGQWNKRNG